MDAVRTVVPAAARASSDATPKAHVPGVSAGDLGARALAVLHDFNRQTAEIRAAMPRAFGDRGGRLAVDTFVTSGRWRASQNQSRVGRDRADRRGVDRAGRCPAT